MTKEQMKAKLIAIILEMYALCGYGVTQQIIGEARQILDQVDDNKW